MRTVTADTALRRSGRPGLAAAAGCAVASFLLVLAPTDALAYLDPGTGSVLLQGLIAAVAAVATFAGMFWQKIKGLFAAMVGRKAGRGGDEPRDTP